MSKNYAMPPEPQVPLVVDEKIANLSDRQFAILAWAAFGKTNQEIGMILDLGRNTVERDFSELIELLDVDCRVKAVEIFLAWSLASDNAPKLPSNENS